MIAIESVLDKWEKDKKSVDALMKIKKKIDRVNDILKVYRNTEYQTASNVGTRQKRATKNNPPPSGTTNIIDLPSTSGYEVSDGREPDDNNETEVDSTVNENKDGE